ncbi:Subtilase family protein [Devosia enhydra]|uniref:Subtilase family protein n=2 Tax=Devosia enhydra TaxID=665118 RepID=A0A1K2HY11_9HYPH|nr:Subtilase family protein [Devosia enhydra]
MQANATVKKAARGVAVAVDSRPGVALITGDARATSPTPKLLSLRRAKGRDPSEPEQDTATFFLTMSNLETLRKNLAAYGDWLPGNSVENSNDDDEDEGGENKPRSFWLFETASTIRPASLRDYWTDSLERLPRTRRSTKWEVWIRKDYRDYFLRALTQAKLELDGKPTEFVEVMVYNVVGTPDQIQRVIQSSVAVVELRSASELAADLVKMPPAARSARVDQVVARLQPPLPTAPRVAVLDTGIAGNHPLLAASTAANGFHAAIPAWGVGDHHGHGTKMAGVVQFLDLEYAMQGSGPIPQYTWLESVVVQAPPGAEPLPARDALERAVALVEKVEAKRVFCLAQTARGEATNGRGTATSAALDLLAYNNGKPRLFCVAAGNVPRTPVEPYAVADYADRNKRFGIEAPGQAFNAITVGAMTYKAQGANLVAPMGDLAPTARSAEAWPKPHPNKPDVVMEGGNFSVDPGGAFAQPSHQNLVLTTGRNLPQSPFSLTGETSAATAAAAGLLGRLQGSYPAYSPASLRGLLVHSAEWTPAMMAQYQSIAAASDQPTARDICLGRYGWGLPNQERAYRSADNACTLVIEDELTPLTLDDKTIKLKEMKYFKLPWPTAALKALGNVQVEMKVTLSYFVEPDPHAYARDRADRYPSHRLRFDVRRFGEDDSSAQSRFNALEDDDGQSDGGWQIGRQYRGRGSLVQDVWTGPAFHLAERDGIAVGPVKGWWADIRKAKRYDTATPFSLIVSIKAPAGAELYTEVAAAAAKVNVLVEASRR